MMTEIRKKNCVYSLEAKVMTFGVQKHRDSKQVGFKQLGHGVEIGVHRVQVEKCVWFEVELHGAQEDRKAEVFQVGANIMVTRVPGQEGADGNIAEKKKVKESMEVNLGKLLNDPLLKTIQEVISLVDKYNNLDDDIDIKDDVKYEKKLDEYFIYDDKLSENNKCFLKEFFRKKMWICKEVDGLDDIDLLLEDETDMLRQECYEAAYSLRYEEYGEEKMRVHSCYFEKSIRELENARKRERENILPKAEIERIE
ncbi:hypothetical protein Tco_1466243 [Tanacetum coccineum]